MKWIMLLLVLVSCTTMPFLNTGGAADKDTGPQVIRQWATNARASSTFAGSMSMSKDDQSPSAATGAPDAEDCGNYKFERYAWSPKKEDGGLQWLELDYEQQVYISGVNIRELSPGGAVVKVEAKKGNFVTVWEGKDNLRACPGYHEIKVNGSDFQTSTIRVTVDTDIVGWNLIDAVELLGYDTKWQIINKSIVFG